MDRPSSEGSLNDGRHRDSQAQKVVRRRSRGIVDVDLVVETGQIFGFLGPNGAGKSTTIRLLLDLIRPTSGSARVLGLDVHRDRLAIDRRVSYVPGRAVAVRRPDRPPAADLPGQPPGQRRRGLPREADRAARARSDKEDQEPLARQQAEGRAGRGVHDPARASDPRRAHGRTRSLHPARIRAPLRGGPRRGPDRLHLVPPAARSRAPVRPRRHHPRRPAARRRVDRDAQGSGPAPARDRLRRAGVEAEAFADLPGRPRPDRRRTASSAAPSWAASTRWSRRPPGSRSTTSGASRRASRRSSWPTTAAGDGRAAARRRGHAAA